MILSIHQPAYLPWLGYFHKIFLSDVFVYLDTTQFEKNSFINRNKIKTPTGPVWLTVPVKLKDHFTKEIWQIQIADSNCFNKHWRTIEQNYKKAPYWDLYQEKIKKLFQKNYTNISDPCFEQLLLFAELLQIKTKIIKTQDIGKYKEKKLDLVLAICKDLKADIYISGKLGRDYINSDIFKENKMKLYYQDYHHPEYKQLGEEFIPYMCVLDLLFNQGPASKDIILSGNITKQDLLTNENLYEPR